VDWDSVDLRYRSAGIEVKTTSAIQAWPHPANVKPSPPRFDIARHEKWDPRTGSYPSVQGRWADCYVFCVFVGPTCRPISPEELRIAVLNTNYWLFHVAPTSEIDELGDQKSIGLSSLAKLWPSMGYEDLRTAIEAALKANGA